MNKVTKQIAVFAVAIAAALTTKAADITVTWEANFAGLALEDGTLLTGGSLVQLGRFTVAPTPGSFDLANFVVFDSAVVGEGFAGIDGFFSKSSTFDEAGFANQQIFVVAFNAVDSVSATQRGIFTTSLPAWVFPESTDIPNSTSIDLADVTSANGVIFGNTAAGVPDGNGNLRLALIPEPTTIVLVAMGMCGALAIRRRK